MSFMSKILDAFKLESTRERENIAAGFVPDVQTVKDSENETNNIKYNQEDYYAKTAKQKENNLKITYDDVECYDLRPFNLNKPFISESSESVDFSIEETKTSKKVKLDEDNADKTADVENHENKPFKYLFPPVSLLNKSCDLEDCWEEVRQRTESLKRTFQVFGVNADIVDISHGVRFTRFEIQIGKGVRIRDILKIEDDIKLNLQATHLHIEAPIPGRTTIGIAVKNKKFSTATFREMIESKEFREFSSNLALVIGKDITGNIIVESLENMCHLLIGGTTGSGKSVCISSIIMSILYKADPNEVKLILIDTKAINLYMYNGIPHMLIPVMTDLRKATAALQWCIAEMTERYRKFSDFGVRDLHGYNKVMEKHFSDNESLQKIPSIVIIIDDFSDLMIADNRSVEESVCRLAQRGRPCGIHLVISTQRPSTDVITGIIKANIPSRISFNVFSAIDSRTILDAKGAEDLLSNGDMLFSPFGARKLIRAQGAFISDEEIANVIEFLKNQMIGYYGIDYQKESEQIKSVNYDGELDPYFKNAGKFVIEKEQASIGMLQRYFKIGFNRAARIIDQLAEAGVVGSEEGTKPRKVIMDIEEFEQYIKECL